MVDEGYEKSEEKIRIEQLPPIVKRLIDTMSGINPSFNLEDWLIEKAEQDFEVLTLDLERERLQLEQRIHRLNSISKRITSEDLREDPKGQTNLFDCFDLPDPLKHLTKRIDEIVEDDPHPVGTFLDLMPGDGCDDPLLAVTAQMMMIVAQEKVGNGASWIELEEMFAPLIGNGFIPEECDEALDHLLMTGQIHEVDDNCFIPDEV